MSHSHAWLRPHAWCVWDSRMTCHWHATTCPYTCTISNLNYAIFGIVKASLGIVCKINRLWEIIAGKRKDWASRKIDEPSAHNKNHYRLKRSLQYPHTLKNRGKIHTLQQLILLYWYTNSSPDKSFRRQSMTYLTNLDPEASCRSQHLHSCTQKPYHARALNMHLKMNCVQIQSTIKHKWVVMSPSNPNCQNRGYTHQLLHTSFCQLMSIP